MSSTTFRQELPPPKGYEKIIYERVPLKGPWMTWKKVTLMLSMTAFGAAIYRHRKQVIQDEQLEHTAARLSIKPLLLAERDRLQLKHMKALRDQEAELMKNVPGWETGTLYGEPVFRSLHPNEYYELMKEDVYALAHPLDFDDIMLHTRYG